MSISSKVRSNWETDTALPSDQESRTGTRDDSPDDKDALPMTFSHDQDINAESGLSDSNEQVAALARTFTRNSVLSPRLSTTGHPFFPSNDTLDPRSPEFDAKAWARALLQAFAKDPERYPRHVIGVSCRDLGVFGFGGSALEQQDVLSSLWRIPVLLREWAGRRRQKIQILRGIEGLVRNGEMLLVLGRPGRYVFDAVVFNLVWGEPVIRMHV
jgi:hypothetical protein